MIPPNDLKSVTVETLTVGPMDPVRFIHAAAVAGFGRVGLLLSSATTEPLQHEIVDRPQVMRDLKTALRETGVAVFDVEAFVLSAQANIERYRRLLEVGADLGATHISCIGTERTGATQALTQTQRVDLFGGLCSEAARFGLVVGVEPMIYRDIPTIAEALALIEACGRSNAGLILDVLHIQRAETRYSALRNLPAARVAYAQICDAAATAPPFEQLPTEARTDRRHPGDGVAPLTDFMALLPQGTPLAVETPVSAESAWSLEDRLKSAADRTLAWFKAIRQ